MAVVNEILAVETVAPGRIFQSPLTGLGPGPRHQGPPVVNAGGVGSGNVASAVAGWLPVASTQLSNRTPRFAAVVIAIDIGSSSITESASPSSSGGILGQRRTLAGRLAARGDDHDPALTAVLVTGGGGGMPGGSTADNHQADCRFVWRGRERRHGASIPGWGLAPSTGPGAFRAGARQRRSRPRSAPSARAGPLIARVAVLD